MFTINYHTIIYTEKFKKTQLTLSTSQQLTFPFCPERSLTPPGETVVDYPQVLDQREAPRPLLPYRHEVVTRWELQGWTVDRPQRPSCPSVPSDNGVERHLGCVCVCGLNFSGLAIPKGKHTSTSTYTKLGDYDRRYCRTDPTMR